MISYIFYKAVVAKFIAIKKRVVWYFSRLTKWKIAKNKKIVLVFTKWSTTMVMMQQTYRVMIDYLDHFIYLVLITDPL
ncbi:hypothetical protein NQ318_001165 [Aromia moschata]|uniref:Uncharacterized protein n=1 Tax=Aromia moschata TaxID=1265417 RepID=A0AAV8ZHB6_9CUCU|nr:hypothetical protein NQ318_001165 [Aromia moschata]